MKAVTDRSRRHSPARAQQTSRAAPAAPVFVVGAPFSGASTLAWALSQHPALESVTGRESAEPLLTALRFLDEDLLPLIARDVVDPIRSALDRVAPSSDSAGAHLIGAIARELAGQIGRAHV